MAGSEIFGQQRFGVERRHEAVDLLAHVRVHELLEIGDELLGALVEAPRRSSSTRSWEKTPVAVHSQLGQRSETRQFSGPASSHSIG